MNAGEIIQTMRGLLLKNRRDFSLAGAPPPWSPPATAEQLAQTESELGFELPEFLKLMYSEIANGGFGPAFGLMSVNDEQYDASLDDVYIVAHYNWAKGDVSGGEAWKWPERIISIADNGCGMRWCLDCRNDEIVFFAGDTLNPDQPNTFHEAFLRTNQSLQEGIAAWLSGRAWDDFLPVE